MAEYARAKFSAVLLCCRERRHALHAECVRPCLARDDMSRVYKVHVVGKSDPHAMETPAAARGVQTPHATEINVGRRTILAPAPPRPPVPEQTPPPDPPQ